MARTNHLRKLIHGGLEQRMRQKENRNPITPNLLKTLGLTTVAGRLDTECL